MAGGMPRGESKIVDAIVERLYQTDMDVHFAFSLVRDERTADLLSQIIERLEGLIRLVQDAAADPSAPVPSGRALMVPTSQTIG